MATNRLVLNTLCDEEEYYLIAIHCSLEAYKLAFWLNKELALKLQRKTNDLDVQYPEGVAYYQFFGFFDQATGCDYFLVGNTYKLKPESQYDHFTLFAEKSITKHLITECKNVDFFLKIEGSIEEVNLKKTLLSLNAINYIVTAYTVEAEQLQSKENLIFN